MVLIGVVAGAVAAIAGFGIGSLLTPALAVVLGTKAAVAIVAIPHAVATSVRLWRLRAEVDRDVLVTFGVASAAGSLVGALLYANFASPVLTVLLGILLVLSGVSELVGLGGRVRLSRGLSVVAGGVSGLFGGLVGNQGGIRSAALLRFGLPGESLVATATATALLVDAARLPVYIVNSGDVLADAWPVVGALTLAVVAGTFIGVPVLRRLPEAQFRRILALLLIGVGVALIASVALDG